MISASGRVSSALRALHVGVHSATAPSLIRQSRVAENSTLALNAARRIHEANVMARPVGAGLATPDLYRVGVWSTRSYRPSGIGLVSCRALSGSPGGDKDKVKYEVRQDDSWRWCYSSTKCYIRNNWRPALQACIFARLHYTHPHGLPC